MKPFSEATGIQIAFFTLVANFVSIPIGRLLARELDSKEFQATISRGLILLIGLIAIVGFPALRRRAAAYLSQPVARQRRRELFVVVLIDISIISFAIAGGIAAWNFTFNGIDGLRRISSPETQLAAALSPHGLAFLLLAAVIAPFVEEIVFRGFLLDACRRRFGWTIGSLLTSAVFAVYHPLFVIAFVQSLIFILVLRRTGSLRGPIVLHACANLSLWYPLIGRFAFPNNPAASVMVWLPHFVSLAIAVLLLPWYSWLAWTRPAQPDLDLAESQKHQ
jgi:membrane protease YdiL (CAAX protease family)